MASSGRRQAISSPPQVQTPGPHPQQDAAESRSRGGSQEQVSMRDEGETAVWESADSHLSYS